MPYLSGDLASFGLAPAPQAPARVNEIGVYFGRGVVGQSTATLAWRNQYIGI